MVKIEHHAPMFTQVSVGYDFTRTMKLDMKKGVISQDFLTDSDLATLSMKQR